MTGEDGGGLPAVRVPRLVGRDSELARLRDALGRPPALVLVEGEAGVGKTRLVHELLAGTGARSMVAVCPPFREASTLGPVVDAARQAQAATQVAGRAGVAGLGLSALAGALRPLFPEWAAGLPPVPEPLPDARATQHRLVRAVAELLDRLGVDLLVVEDAHWADEATVELLLFLASRQPQQVSLVVTYRPEEVPAGSTLRRLTSRRPVGASHVRACLDTLDVPGTAQLVSSMLDDERVSTVFARFLHDQTEGLPLAVEESVRLLRDRADLIRVDGEWVRRTIDEIAVPPTMRDAVLERAARLDAAAQRLLDAAAVLAEPVQEAVLAAVAGQSAEAGLPVALGSGLLVEDERGRATFKHVLAARAVYDAMPGSHRRRLHARAAAALEAAAPPPSPARLAHHFRAAGDEERWCHHAERAADLALASGDHTTAVTSLLDLLTGADLAPATLTRVARKLPTLVSTGYLRRSGVVQTLREMLDRADLAVTERAELRAQLGRSLMQAGEYEAGAAELERAIPDLGHKPVQAAFAMSSLGLPFSTPWPARVHRRWLDRAAAAVTPSFPERDRLGLRIDRMTALLDLGDAEGWAVAAGLPDTPAGPEDLPQVARSQLNMGNAAMRWGRYGEARERLERGAELSEQYGYLRLRDMIAVTVAHLDWFTGSWAGLGERAGGLAGFDDETLIRLDALIVAGLLDVATGAYRRADEQLRSVLDEARARGLVELLHEPAAALARMRLAGGDVDSALALTEQPITLVVRKEIWLWGTEIAPARVDALTAAGQVGEARALVSALGRGFGACTAPVASAALATCRAGLAEGVGHHLAAAEAFAQAAAGWDALPRPYAAALARERQAGCLVAAGDRDVGLGLLGEVLRTLSDLGASGDADRVARVLRRHGVTPRRRRRGYGDQLSPRELEVVRLMVTGLTNPQIARALSRSPKTVAAQLNSAMRKFGVTSRTALAVSAVQAGVAAADD